MLRAKFAHVLAGLAVFVLMPPPASAQSTIEGIVRDPSGGVMPGVAVEASSPALIEKSRAVITNGQGRYEIIDLRPGAYSLTFTAPGFKTVRRENIELPADVTFPVYVEMAVGVTTETVKVEASAAVVDVQSTTHTIVHDREFMDQIPSSRTFQQLAGLTPGIRLTTPDVGGSQQMEQTYVQGHGSAAVATTVMLDGMYANSNYLDGLIQNYIDDALIQETTYGTSGVSAEVASGGPLINMVPKDGGNEFHGAVFAGHTGQGSIWQASSVPASLISRGLVGAQVIEHIQNFDGSIGGPFIKNKLWFVGSSRYNSTYDSPPGVFYPKPDGTPDLSRPGIEEQWIASGTLRLTWNINSKMKFSGTYERNIKHKGHELTGVAFKPLDPSVAAQRRGGTLYYVAQGKWSYIVSPRLLVDAGFTTNIIHYAVVYQPGQEKVPFTPEWYAGASHTDSVLVTRTNAPGVQSFYLPDRRGVSASVSYTNGSHTLKAGVQDGWGKNDRVSSVNADLVQQYQNGVPFSVQIQNTPLASRVRVDADLGLFAEDKWTFKRFTLTAGLRWEYQKASIQPTVVGPGRFVPARSFPLIDCRTIPGMGCWKTWAPRLGLVYDLFGNGKTAVRASFGKFNVPQDTGYLDNFNLMALSTDTRTWRDCPYPQTSCVKGGTNGDDIAQDNELGPSQNINFGKITNRTLDPHFKREYNLQYKVSVQHAVRPGMSVGFDYFRTTNYNTLVTIDRAYNPVTDWTPFTIVNPLTGEQITAYNLNANAVGRAHDYYQTNGDQDLRHTTYTGFELYTHVRLPHGAFVFGGWTVDRTVITACDGLTGASALVNSTNDPNQFRFCDQAGARYQDLGKNVSIPFRHEFKVAGNFPLWKGFQVSMALQVDPEPLKTVTWNITNATRYPFDCSVPGCTPGALVMPAGVTLRNASEAIPLVAPGTRFQDRVAQLDLGLRRVFRIRERIRVSPQIDVFNVNNSHAVLTETQALGTSGTNTFTGLVNTFRDGGPGGTPQTLLTPRILRLSVQLQF
ncbi:MAG TPA: TonB-dependent receptor [Bryobacteraceae bacterium]|nr:TonB-dependent receptor [Bryobacteraceae bacterium]